MLLKWNSSYRRQSAAPNIPTVVWRCVPRKARGERSIRDYTIQDHVIPYLRSDGLRPLKDARSARTFLLQSDDQRRPSHSEVAQSSSHLLSAYFFLVLELPPTTLRKLRGMYATRTKLFNGSCVRKKRNCRVLVLPTSLHNIWCLSGVSPFLLSPLDTILHYFMYSISKV